MLLYLLSIVPSLSLSWSKRRRKKEGLDKIDGCQGIGEGHGDG